MPRKKETAAEPVPSSAAEKDTITVSIEVSKVTYERMMTAARTWRYTLDEWLAEVISDSI